MEFNIKDSNGKNFKFIREDKDPLCLRVSLGGTEADGYYLVFRGDINEVEKMIDEAQILFKTAKEKLISQSN